MAEVKIPNIGSDPFVVVVNGNYYSYKAGSTADVPKDVEAVIKNINALMPREKEIEDKSKYYVLEIESAGTEAAADEFENQLTKESARLFEHLVRNEELFAKPVYLVASGYYMPLTTISTLNGEVDGFNAGSMTGDGGCAAWATKCSTADSEGNAVYGVIVAEV